MKKYILFFLVCSCCGLSLFSQNDTLKFENRIDAGNYVYGLLDDQLYDGALLDRAMSNDPILYSQLLGDYDQTFSTTDWCGLYSDLSLAYKDTTLVPGIPQLWGRIEEFFIYHDYNYQDLIQPFVLTIQNVSYLDTNNISGQDFTFIEGQMQAIGDESTLYSKLLVHTFQ